MKESELSPQELKKELLKLSTQLLGQSNRELNADWGESMATYDKSKVVFRLANMPNSSFDGQTSRVVLDWFRDAVLGRGVRAGEVDRLATESFIKS